MCIHYISLFVKLSHLALKVKHKDMRVYVCARACLSAVVCVFVCVSFFIHTCLSMPRALLWVSACLFVCLSAVLQEVNPYSMVASDPNEFDRRYCVLKLQVPYSDLMHSPHVNSGHESSTLTF